MPLSEHEQRQLDQIERGLYAEDPKFAQNVRGKDGRGRLRRWARSWLTDWRPATILVGASFATVLGCLIPLAEKRPAFDRLPAVFSPYTEGLVIAAVCFIGIMVCLRQLNRLVTDFICEHQAKAGLSFLGAGLVGMGLVYATVLLS